MVKYDEYTSVLSIAQHKEVDSKSLLTFTTDFLTKNNIEFNKIYDFNTNVYYEDFVKIRTLQNDKLSLEDLNIYDSRYYNSDWSRENVNEYLFASVGLDKETRSRHFNSFINNKLSVGVLESGVVESHFPTFEWNRKYGNGIWWRNEWFFNEKHTRHSTQVAELIAGKKGIMPTLGIVSVQVAINWNGISGEMNYLLRHTNIVNNSWSLGFIKKLRKVDPQMLKYNWLSKYLDDLIYNNKELINIVAASNY
ncbi:S8/S53 family peptidase [Mycoplasmopsis bovirhinis]|uniref:Uncharacterized protein n=1 Tax=Mycoplasmopsis bovirhinis TaxID=29553 RepID=A0A449ADY5_9BACT|nr:hypothetical protein [Mycoplasmopsis bovirhinis]VEU63194.1 Uncharacterised protein [Mycoplasmopsis bovirhinis]